MFSSERNPFISTGIFRKFIFFNIPSYSLSITFRFSLCIFSVVFRIFFSSNRVFPFFSHYFSPAEAFLRSLILKESSDFLKSLFLSGLYSCYFIPSLTYFFTDFLILTSLIISVSYLLSDRIQKSPRFPLESTCKFNIL